MRPLSLDTEFTRIAHHKRLLESWRFCESGAVNWLHEDAHVFTTSERAAPSIYVFTEGDVVVIEYGVCIIRALTLASNTNFRIKCCVRL